VARFVRQNGLHNVSVRRVHGKNSGWGHIEGNLDVEYLLSVADAAGADSPFSPPISTDYWLSSDFPFGMGFDIVGWAAGVIADDTAALVWSVSYGEALGAVSAGYAQRLDIEMQKLGVLGISVFFASGDSGVYSRSGGYREFNPTFPACLPSVTAVGATQRNASGAEDAGVDFSGGGFSSGDTFVRERDAPWQIKAVETYLATAALPPAHLWNRDGRCVVCWCLCVSMSVCVCVCARARIYAYNGEKTGPFRTWLPLVSISRWCSMVLSFGYQALQQAVQ
jgi:subtilase family serine protease